MKLPLLLFCTAFFFLIQKETPKLKGTYKVEFDRKYSFQTYTVTFDDSTYSIRLQDARTFKGKIAYAKFKAVIKEMPTENKMEIDNREINKDTIAFVTRSKSNAEMVVSRGKLIKQ